MNIFLFKQIPGRRLRVPYKHLIAALVLTVPLLTSCSATTATSVAALQPAMETLLAPTLNSVILPALNSAFNSDDDIDPRAYTELQSHNITKESAPYLWAYLEKNVSAEELAKLSQAATGQVPVVETPVTQETDVDLSDG